MDDHTNHSPDNNTTTEQGNKGKKVKKVLGYIAIGLLVPGGLVVLAGMYIFSGFMSKEEYAAPKYENMFDN